jgi:AraC-like DNA-binding protein
MISQTELTLSEIAWKLRYSSPAHLSAQFKRITGIAPSVFRKIKDTGNPEPDTEYRTD